MKTILIIALCLLLTLNVLLLFTGCKQVIDTKTEIVEATVTNTYYKNAMMVPIRSGKITTWIRHPAKYCVTVTYGHISTTRDSQAFYNKYKDNIGAIIECELITTYYDDGTSKQTLRILED